MIPDAGSALWRIAGILLVVVILTPSAILRLPMAAGAPSETPPEPGSSEESPATNTEDWTTVRKKAGLIDPPNAVPAPGVSMGIQSDIQPHTDPLVQRREIALMREMDVRWVRIVMNWYAAEPAKGRYSEHYLRGMESLVDRLREAGMQVMFLVLATPPWANPAGWRHPPLRMRDLGEFVGYAVRRFSSRVKHWEIWNEPDWHEFWKPAPNVAGFVEMLKEAYTAGKAANPEAVFISGGLAGNHVEYLRRMYALGAGRYLDAVGVHPYVFRRSPDEVAASVRHSFHGLGELRKVMVAAGDGAKPLWITEMSWPTNQRAPGAVGDWAEGVSPEVQAAYLVRAYQKLQTEYPYVSVAMWYNLRDKGTDATYVEHNWGLVRWDFQPKPAFFAFQQQARTMGAPVVARP